MLLPIGVVNLLPITAQGGVLATPVKLPQGRNKTFQFRGQISSGTGTAVLQALGSNIPNPKTLGDYCLIGSAVTLSLVATGTISGVVEDNAPYLYVSVSLTSISAGGQVECWVAS